MNDKGLHEYLFAVGPLSLFNISVHTRQHTERTVRPVTLSDITSYRGTQPEEQNNRRKRNKAEISIMVLLVMAKPQTRHDCLTRGAVRQSVRQQQVSKFSTLLEIETSVPR